jgi:hypothetical protein
VGGRGPIKFHHPENPTATLGGRDYYKKLASYNLTAIIDATSNNTVNSSKS